MVRAGCSDTPGTKSIYVCSWLFHEYEVHGKDKEDYRNEVIPLECLSFEEY